MKSLMMGERLHGGIDRVGAALSTACAIHCALMPVVLMALPFIGATFIADERLEWAVVGTSAVLGFSSLCLGMKKHKKRRAFGLLSAGMLLVLGGRLFFEHRANHGPVQGVVLLLGGLMVAAAHIWNKRLCASCPECQKHSCC